MSRVFINIVTWNSRRFLAECLESVFNQEFQHFSVLIVDNASNDGTVQWLDDKYKGRVTVLRNAKNLGFCRGHNQGIEFAKQHGAQFVLVMNPDIILSPNYLQQVVASMELDSKIGSLGGKLLRAHVASGDLNETIKTGIIDSTGVKIFKSGKVVDRGAGEQDEDQFDNLNNVFGISGALALYRVQALDDVKIKNQYFIEDFFAYKEDVDLAWRLQLKNWPAFYLPEAMAYHHRAVAAHKESGWRETFKHRKSKSSFVNAYSYKNHLLMLIHNYQLRNFIRNFFSILKYEFPKFLVAFFEPSTRRLIPQIIKEAPGAFSRRRMIQKSAKVSAKEFRKYLS